jgi:hypothetical protein
MSIDQFPMMVIKTGMTDSDREFHSDMAYFADLLVDIHEAAYRSRYANPIPITMSDELDAAISAVQAIR